MYDFNIEELKEKIAAQLSVEEVLDLLDYTLFDLVELLEDDIEKRRKEFLLALRETSL
jgi:hypothetical protein